MKSIDRCPGSSAKASGGTRKLDPIGDKMLRQVRLASKIRDKVYPKSVKNGQTASSS